MSGYCNCACPECFEIAISDCEGNVALCHECEEVGCDGEGGCDAPAAYGALQAQLDQA